MSINIGLKQDVRRKIAKHLGLILSDLYILYVKTQNFHWNIVDPRFYSLHLFFEEHYKEMAETIDEIAERIRMLGERSPASLKEFLKLASLKESTESLTGDQMIQILLEDHESVIKNLRKEIQRSSESDDEGTADLLINCLRFHEKTAWMLRSHLPRQK